MSQNLSNDELAEALETCASEPVHIPGCVQPFAALVAFDTDTSVISYASENTGALLGVATDELLGNSLHNVCGGDVWHAFKNAMSRPDFSSQSIYMGDFPLWGGSLCLHAFESEGLGVIEFERQQKSLFSGPDGLKTLRMFMENIEKAENEASLYKLTTQLLRHITGYHRVMIYRFDQDFNGEILAEARRSNMESFLGLRFPHWDIPSQARAMMETLPLRIIENIAQVPVPLAVLNSELPPLDISRAVSRGVSPVHMQYLQNMGVAATMTLTIKVAGKLWGIVSFHHEKPRVPSPALRETLINIAQVFSTKLQLLQQKNRLALISQVDALKDNMLETAQSDDAMKSFLASVMQVLRADGVLIFQNDTIRRAGMIPDDPLISALRASAAGFDEVLSYEALSQNFPGFAGACNGCAGALVYGPDDVHCLMVFRREIEREVSWAGNPEKTVEKINNRLRISPRGSFSTYLEQVRGHAEAWSEEDLYFASRIWAVINTIKRRELIQSLNRQQKILIDELNHRVRNILALVRSVSKQSQKNSQGSLQSYSQSLEARIQALAASHELASASSAAVISIEKLIEREFEPYLDEASTRIEIKGSGLSLRAEIAPVFSLVVHELVTNAVKYGALSEHSGKVSIDLKREPQGLRMIWRESGGPPVVDPKGPGFGSTLIQRAVPHELGGEAQLEFRADGLVARIVLPQDLFDTTVINLPVGARVSHADNIDANALADALKSADCLLVEDNYMIAAAAEDDLFEIGVRNCETVAGVDGALDFLSTSTPSFAVLDINLGQGETSLAVAHKLLNAGVPFFFLTGYGEKHDIPAVFDKHLTLTKPVTVEALRSAVARTLLG